MLHVEGLRKRFDNRAVVDGLSFSVREGEIFGLLVWEIAGTLLGLSLGAYALRRLAGKIFRVGMLRYGQQVSLKDLRRWLRA